MTCKALFGLAGHAFEGSLKFEEQVWRNTCGIALCKSVYIFSFPFVVVSIIIIAMASSYFLFCITHELCFDFSSRAFRHEH